MALLGALSLGACSSDETVGRAMVAPGSYVFYDCTQLDGLEKSYLARNIELKRLMARAKEGPIGGAISAMTYDADYYSNLGYVHSVRQQRAEKECPPVKPSPAR